MKKENYEDIFKKFIEYGSGFRIEGERVYDKKGEPLIYRLRMSGMIYPNGYEIVGYDLEKLMKQAMRDGNKFIKRNKNKLYGISE